MVSECMNVETNVSTWLREALTREGPFYDVDESIDNLQRHLDSAYALQDDWHVQDSEIRIACDCDGKHSVRARMSSKMLDAHCVVCRPHLTVRNRKVLLTLHSLKQICEEMGLGINAMNAMLEKPELLAKSLNCLFENRGKTREWLLRQRLGTSDGKSCWVLRAFLDKKYNRLDNIHLLESLRSFCKLKKLEFSSFAFDGTQLFLHLINPADPTGFSTKVDDEFCTGLAIANSEIESTNVIEVEYFFERLICSNGMTVPGRQKTYMIRKEVELNTNFYNELPAHPLQGTLVNQIHEYILGELKSIFMGLPSAKKSLVDFSGDLSNRTFRAEEVREILRTVLREMSASRDMDIDGVMRYFNEEQKDFKHGNTYWAVFNAITRYISHEMVMADPPNMNFWHKARTYRKMAGKKTRKVSLPPHQIPPPKPKAKPHGPPIV